MANTPRSRKAKGRKLQNDVRDLIKEHFPQLHPDDVVSTQMGGSGTDIQLSPAARQVLPYSIECKNQEKLNVWASLEQAENNVKEGTYPVLFFKRNRSKMYVAMDAEHFFELIKRPKPIDNPE
jgi:hypothetical protein